MDYLKDFMINIKKVIKEKCPGLTIIITNPFAITWFVIYFYITFRILGGNFGAFIVTLLAYSISLFIALSPIGEMIIKFINGARKLETRKEKEYLIPLFEEVYEQILENVQSQQSRQSIPTIEIHIIDKLTVNACAMGVHTIAVTKGAIETFTEEELKGVIAHEIAHILNGDTLATLLNLVGNGFISIYVVFVKICIKILELLADPLNSTNKGLAYYIVRLIEFSFEIGLFLFTFIGNAILSLNSRDNEYNADKFSLNNGFGDGLINALYLLQKMSLGENMSLVQHILASHPHIAKRIGKLENIEEELDYLA